MFPVGRSRGGCAAVAALARAAHLRDLALVVISASKNPMAQQMAKLLASSDLPELKEVVARWLAEAPTDRVREHYRRFGAKLLELKQVLAHAPQQPSEEELELALTMMLKLAAENPDRGQSL